MSVNPMNAVTTTGTITAEKAASDQSPDGSGATVSNGISDNMASYVDFAGDYERLGGNLDGHASPYLADLRVHSWYGRSSVGNDNPTSVADARRLIAEHEAAIERCKEYIEEQRKALEEAE